MKLFLSTAFIFGFTSLFSLQNYNIEETIVIENDKYTKIIQAKFSDDLSVSVISNKEWTLNEDIVKSGYTIGINNFNKTGDFFITPIGKNIDGYMKSDFLNNFLDKKINISPSDLKNELLDPDKGFFYFYTEKSLCNNNNYTGSIVGLIDIDDFTFAYLGCVNDYNDFDDFLFSIESITVS
jgi:hypothetical protein